MLFYIGNYQNTVFDSNCINCQKLIKFDADLGKFCRYISGKILQFCGIVCMENYENSLSLCSFCQKELVDNHFEVMILIRFIIIIFFILFFIFSRNFVLHFVKLKIMNQEKNILNLIVLLITIQMIHHKSLVSSSLII